MLTLKIPITEEGWDSVNECFILPEYKTIQLEHSLVSVSKWESIWHIPFLDKKEKTFEQTISYIKCMTITQNVSDSVYEHITNQNIQEVEEYILNPMTATWFLEHKSLKKTAHNTGEQVTSEVIYYWMTALQIPMECQKWHLNRLLTLVRVCNEKNQPEKKMNRKDQIEQQRALMKARRAKHK